MPETVGARFLKAAPSGCNAFRASWLGNHFTRADLDCLILFGDGNWPGAVAAYIAGHEMALIAPPALASQSIKKAQDLASQTLLHLVSVPDGWAQWVGCLIDTCC